MDDKEILNRIREAIACLDEAQLDLPIAGILDAGMELALVARVHRQVKLGLVQAGDGFADAV